LSENISSIVVFIEGMASFLSPCVLPLMPIYLGYLTGGVLEDIKPNDTNLKKIVFINSIGFLLGLTIVFVALGATATALGKFLYFNSNIIRKIGGIIIIIFGLYHMGIIKIRALDVQRRFSFKSNTPGFINLVIIGMAFSFGWTPCIGAILGSVLMMAASLDSYVEGIYLLAIYSLGFSIPFLFASMFLNAILKRINNLDKYMYIIKVVSGILLIIMGILVYTNYLNRISGLLL